MAFLTNYNNPEYESMDDFTKTRLYPMGGTMPISYWGYPVTETTSFSLGIKPSDIDKMVASGFTGYGNDFSNSRIELKNDAAEYAGLAGLRHICFCSDGTRPNFSRHCGDGILDNGVREQAAINAIGNNVAGFVADPRWNDYIDMWLSATEETGQRMDVQSRECGRTAAGRFLKAVRLKVNANDPQKRPWVGTDLSGTSVSQWNFINKYRESYATQTYITSTFRADGNHDGSKYYYSAITQKDARLAQKAAETQTFDTTVPTLEKQFTFPLIGPYYAMQFPDPTYDNYVDYAGYMVITNIAQGAKGFQFYGWSLCKNLNHTSASNSELEIARAGILGFVKKFTDYNFQNACLWGRDMIGQSYGIGISWTGPQDANFYYDAESMTYFDRQLGNCRYLGFTNSHWTDTCRVTITGLPIGGYITDIRTEVTTEITNSSKFFNVVREDWQMFKISETPPGPPTVTQATTNKSVPYEFDDIATITADTTGDTGHKWQYRNKGETLETDWKDIIQAPVVFSITQHPQSITKNIGNTTPIFSISYTPSINVNIQWQWRNIRAEQTAWISVVNNNSDPSKYSMTKDIIVLGHDDDRFKAVLTYNGVVKNSNEAILTVV